MEDLVQEFLRSGKSASIYDYASGYGSGHGNGLGDDKGDGHGDRYGDGDGSGSGDGSGYGGNVGSGDGGGFGDGFGNGVGDGSGRGSGDGSGYGYGNGVGDGSGRGSGDGSAGGSGDGYGYGYGYGGGSAGGTGDGDGYGYGDGDGYGDGSGFGYGYGYGYGHVHGSLLKGVKSQNHRYRKGDINMEIATLKSFKGNEVYYVDNIPCYFLAIKGDIAKVMVIRDDFTVEKQYVAKSGDFFAHGKTKEQALQSVQEKFLASLSFKEKKDEFIRIFKIDKEYPTSIFYKWHHHLTGSCKIGRDMFIKSHEIDINGMMTTRAFLELTKNEYNGVKIKEILEKLK